MRRDGRRGLPPPLAPPLAPPLPPPLPPPLTPPNFGDVRSTRAVADPTSWTTGLLSLSTVDLPFFSTIDPPSLSRAPPALSATDPSLSRLEEPIDPPSLTRDPPALSATNPSLSRLEEPKQCVRGPWNGVGQWGVGEGTEEGGRGGGRGRVKMVTWRWGASP